MTEEKKRERPPISTFTDNPDRSRRTAVNLQYAINATVMITRNSDRIPNHELLWFTDDEKKTAKGKWGVLEQLGRMIDQDMFGLESCIYVAQLSAQALKAGHKAKEVELAIRRIRMAAKRKELAPENGHLKYELDLAILALDEMGEDEYVS